MIYFSVQDALARLARLVGSLPDWSSLETFLPEGLGNDVARRAALSATLVAGLEMARDGRLALRQETHFGPIHLRAPKEGEERHDRS
jgi:segregation and condensation protein A